MSIFAKVAQIHLQTHKPYKSKFKAEQRIGFFPHRNPSTLHNCKQYFLIQPDGKSLHTVYFNPLEKSFREELIFNHYLSNYCRLNKMKLGYSIISRDAPWDFRVGLSTGPILNVEIVSFSDRNSFFKILAAEELIQRHSYYPTIRLGILQKLVNHFPDTEISEYIEDHKKKGKARSSEVTNPFYPLRPKAFMSLAAGEVTSVSVNIIAALNRKNNKKHKDKEDTILIFDNRTTTPGLDIFIKEVQTCQAAIMFSEFLELWIYTGYGGGHNPKFEDYLLLPLKLPTAGAGKGIGKFCQITKDSLQALLTDCTCPILRFLRHLYPHTPAKYANKSTTGTLVMIGWPVSALTATSRPSK